MLSKKIIMK